MFFEGWEWWGREEARLLMRYTRGAICFDINQHNVHQQQTLTTTRNRLLQWIKRSGRETLIISITIDYYPLLSADTLWRENYLSWRFHRPNLGFGIQHSQRHHANRNCRWDCSTTGWRLIVNWNFYDASRSTSQLQGGSPKLYFVHQHLSESSNFLNFLQTILYLFN